jgi:hypothetical protein
MASDKKTAKTVKNARKPARPSLITKKTAFVNPAVLVFVLVVVLLGGYTLARYSHAASDPNVSATGSHTPEHWLMTSNLVSAYLQQQPSNAGWFFNTTKAFTMDAAGDQIAGISALPLRNYKSYAQFARDIASHAIPASVHRVVYDNENWSYTPRAEAQQPATYMKMFATLAHQHGLQVYEVPARDLVDVSGAACHQSGSESVDQAYIRCRIPADAQYADYYEVQAQADQANTASYTNLVEAARTQIKAVAPTITFMSGFTTDRGNNAAQIVACWKATHTLVSGYWMNSTSSTFQVAKQAFTQIRTYGG